MVLNGKMVVVSSHVSEILDEEMIIYNEAYKKIIVLNHTAIVVWNKIIESNTTNSNIGTFDIVAEIMQIYNVPKCDTNIIYNDVEDAIKLLYEASLLQIPYEAEK